MELISERQFEDFVRGSSGQVMAVIRRIVRNSVDAEDLLQETLLAAWKALDQFQGKSSLATWVHRIAINKALNRIRSAPERYWEGSPALENLAESGTEDHPRDFALRDIVWKAIDSLPEPQRLVLILKDVDGLSSPEVCAKLNLSPMAVRQRLHRARKHVAETLSPDLCTADELTCGGQLDLLMDQLDGVLEGPTHAAVSLHVRGCRDCQGNEAAYHRTIRLVQECPLAVSPVPDRLILNILDLVRGSRRD